MAVRVPGLRAEEARAALLVLVPEGFEEIDRVPPGQAGLNMGWYWMEGFDQRRSDAPQGLTAPVHAYSHAEGSAVIGGAVYRGTAVPALRGAYVFGDLTGPVWALGADGFGALLSWVGSV